MRCLGACFTLALAACSMRHATQEVEGAYRAAVHGERSSVETQALAVEGVVMVDVSNFAGSVTIIGGGAAAALPGDVAQVEIVRRAVRSDGRGRAAVEALGDIRVSVRLEPGGPQQVLRVEGTTSRAMVRDQRCDLTISVPALAGVRVRTTAGAVAVRQCTGGVDIDTTDGGVEVATAAAIDSPVTILAEDGDIDWRVGAFSRGSYDLGTIGGEVVAKVRSGSWVVTDRRNDEDTMLALLNGGGPRVVLRTVEGDIRISVAPAD